MLLVFRLCGVLYILSGIWCAFQFEVAARFLGLELLEGLGKSEFLSVYGGLQVGLGLSICLSSIQPRYIEGSIYYSAIFSSVLAAFRIVSFLIFGWQPDFALIMILEILIAGFLWCAWLNFKKYNDNTELHQG